ncbi:MAG TPA: response regulator [Nitrososphaeraceae archaeon]|nr:response regulator [Nitrososphaeraceae archaeon]
MVNILLVEDEEDLLRLIQKYFEKNGLYVRAYTSPLLALEEFMKNTHDNGYDLVISDFRMPGMNGIELATLIRKMNKDIPIILMTAYDVIDVDPLILKFLNIEYIITKPIKLRAFIEKIKLNKKLK